MPKRHRNIPIFIPHLGCPNQCVFCNQHSISGAVFEESRVASLLETALSTLPAGAPLPQIAFFGGSFTGIDRGLMVRLLEIAEGYVQAGKADSIRFSTRPDYLSPEIFSILSDYSVKNVELGLQSFSDRVLAACKRGHTASVARQACLDVVDHGYRLTGQMMIGLPLADADSECATAEEICLLGASESRIYPTVVFAGTPLAASVADGSYRPLSLEEAVTRSARVLRIFEDASVDCIRIGLCSGENLNDPQCALSGANHPALGELVRSELCFDRMMNEIRRLSLSPCDLCLQVPAREVSLWVGQKRQNLEKIRRETGFRIVKVMGTDGGFALCPMTE